MERLCILPRTVRCVARKPYPVGSVSLRACSMTAGAIRVTAGLSARLRRGIQLFEDEAILHSAQWEYGARSYNRLIADDKHLRISRIRLAGLNYD